MLPISRTFLATIVSAAFLPTAFADESSSDSVPEIVPVDQCIAPEENSADPAQETVNIEADSIHAEGKDKAVYQGDVIVTQGHKKITADKVTLNQSESSVVADGNVTMNDGQIKSTSNKAKSDFKGERIELHDTKYQLLCQPARGEATYILKDGQSIYTMKDGSLTTCPEGNKSWRVKATNIDIDNEEEEATFYNTRFEILDVPVFYWPYITVPIGDKRKTGFLYPSGGYDSKNGLEINVPIYFNIAPQYDLTTTVNYMQRRGVQFENEFRYLTDGFGAGSLDFEYLHDDDLYNDKGSRWGVNFSHDGIYNRHWKFSVDYSRVSDDDYFSDLDSNIGNREDGQLLQAGEVSYRTDYSDTTLKVRDFQVLSSSQPYRLMPQLQYEYNRPDVLPHIDMEWNSHISRFETDDDDLPDATRVHLEPGVVVPFYAPWGQLTSEAKLMYTYYDQDLKNGTSASSDLKENASRTVPEYRMTGTLFLDNSQKWLGGYTQTLEPRLQYLYIPEVDQDDIYQGYDTTLMQLDYYGLFRDTRYSSIDYIAPANQLSYGATSRFYDENYKERFNVSLGQIYYINPESGEANLSAWALENEWNINDEWLFKGGVQYDGDMSELQLANSTLEYKLPGGGYTQLNYRYIAKSYIEDNATNLSNVDQYTRDGISQAGILNSFTIAQRWSVQANYYHDLTEQTMLESLVGVTYNDDCWFLGLTYSRHIMNSGDVRNVYPEPGPEYESKVSLNIGIKGLGQSTGLTYSDGGNALGYGRPFSLAD